MLLVAEIVFPGSCRLQQPIVQRAPFRRQRHAPLLNFAKAGAMGASVFSGEHHRLLKRLKAGLPQEDRDLPARWPFNQRFGFNTALRHQGLDAVNIQRPRREMVDMTPRETDHIGNQAVLAMQSMVSLLIDGGLPVPAERLQRLLDKLARVGRGEFALCFILRNQRQAAGVKILRRARIASARSRRARFSISSRRSSEVKIRNGLRASAASSMGRNAVEWTGTPACERS